MENGGSIEKWRLDWKMEALLKNGGSIGKSRLDWKIEARLCNRASFVAEWQNEVLLCIPNKKARNTVTRSRWRKNYF